MAKDIAIKVNLDSDEAFEKMSKLAAAAKEAGSAMAPKPGYLTTEFWGVTVAWLLAAFLASGVLPETHVAVKIASFIAAALAQVGYSTIRGYLKSK